MINNPAAELLPGFGGDPLLSRIYRLREVLLERLYQLFPKPENALMAGILLGDESKITSDIDHAFQKTGTAHIIAIISTTPRCYIIFPRNLRCYISNNVTV